MTANPYFILFIILAMSCKDLNTDLVSDKKEISEIVTMAVEIPKEIEQEASEKLMIDLEGRISKDFLHGTWQNINHEDIDFILHVNIVEDLVLGEYCSKAKNFFFEDCSSDDGGEYCMIKGPLNKYSIDIILESCVNAKIAEGMLRRKNAELILDLDKSAGEYGVDHLIPDTVLLKKISNEAYL